MSMMITGELCNFAAYAFVEAIVVTPLGALSVVVCAMLSSIFLNEKLTFFGWLGCALCLLGSVIIALNGPQEQSVGQITQFQKMFLAPGFLAYGSVLIAASLTIIFYFGPKYGKKLMIWYILVCSMIGGISVSVTTGLGAAIVTTAFGDNQFKHWFIYFLLGFVVITLLTEVYYLNVALALFNTAMVTPTYYVIFTFFSMVTTIVLYKGLQSSASQIVTLVMGFLVICVGITILQMSKIDPNNLAIKLDRRSTMLLQMARARTEAADEKSLTGIEDPGMDTLRGSFGAVGSIIRARSARRASQSSSKSKYRTRPTGPYDPTALSWVSEHDRTTSPVHGLPLGDPLSGLVRHQLYDAPVPKDDASSAKSIPASTQSQTAPIRQSSPKRTTIKFGDKDVVHQYNRPGTGDNRATHDFRAAHGPPITTTTAAAQTSQLSSSSQQDARAPSEGDLVIIDSPEELLNLIEIGGEAIKPKQTTKTVLLPPPDAASGKSMSAPPTSFNTRFVTPNSTPGLPSGSALIPPRDSRISEDGTLMTFPSVTDTASSEVVWDDEEVERQKEMARARDRLRSLGIGGKRYPRSSSVDSDKEERVSLWQQGRSGAGTELDHDTEGDGEGDADPHNPLAGASGGIRLVQPRKAPEL
ncbi:hypothetical protein AX14_011256 [Amanita brunnescens Koide BX004]|nr:hypothetical protein AX14_011256 [Amanita brunnescens Koide BX004]